MIKKNNKNKGKKDRILQDETIRSMKMKSIFENICNNIQENGKLNPRFDINKYIEDEEILRFEPGALDGIARYHMQKKEDKRFKNYIIKILKRTDDKNIQEQAETITEYIIKNKNKNSHF